VRQEELPGVDEEDVREDRHFLRKSHFCYQF
jgi:hypothetical protein